MKLETKIKKFRRDLNEGMDEMLRFKFPCGHLGFELEDGICCQDCDTLIDCIDYFSCQDEKKRPNISFERWLNHKEQFKKVKKIRRDNFPEGY